MGPFKRNLPNLLSGLRIFLMIPFVLAIRNNDSLMLIISAVSIVLTDYLDGKLARAWNVVSKTGKVLDPLADKICTALTALSLVLFRGFPVWLLVIIIIRDVGILLAGLILIKYRRFVPVSDTIGKIAMVSIVFCLLTYLFNVHSLQTISMIETVVALVASAASYGVRFLRTWAGTSA